jgi:hypothetical protein
MNMRQQVALWVGDARRRFGMWRAGRRRPVITAPLGSLPIGRAPYTFVAVVPPLFNQTVPMAITLARLGWCRGFEQVGIPYMILGTDELAARLPDLPNPICLLQNSDYLFLDRSNRAALARTRHFVWLDYWFREDVATFRRAGFDYQSFAQQTHRQVLEGAPAFGFTISPRAGLDSYARWMEQGLQVESLPLACDTTVYHPHTPDVAAFADVQMAFVGGYWPFKAQQFDRYLRPFEQELTIFGRERWPYAGYGGKLPADQEAALYRQARLAPTINEPHCERLNIDLNERVFKVLGSGGCSITDAVSGYREWFAPDELAVPTSLNEYRELVAALLHDDALNAAYRARGYAAVTARHTYAHRARAALALLQIVPPIEEG